MASSLDIAFGNFDLPGMMANNSGSMLSPGRGVLMRSSAASYSFCSPHAAGTCAA